MSLSFYYRLSLCLINANYIQLIKSQHGFRRMHNTTMSLNAITTRIHDVFNQPLVWLRNILVALHLSKTFDAIVHTQHQVNRHSECGSHRGLLFPTLFNLYLLEVPRLHEVLQIISYVDDDSSLTTGGDISNICVLINEYLLELKLPMRSGNDELLINSCSFHHFDQRSKESTGFITGQINICSPLTTLKWLATMLVSDI